MQEPTFIQPVEVAEEPQRRPGAADDVVTALGEALEESGLDGNLGAVPEDEEDLVPKAPASFSLVTTKQGRHIGSVARWRFIADHFVIMEPGNALSYEDMALILGLDFNNDSHLRMIKAAARRAAEAMLHQHRRVFETVRGYGYEECKPRQVVAIAENAQGRALGLIETGSAKLATVDTSGMGVQEKQSLEQQRMLLGHQVQVMRTADIRSTRRQEAFDRLRQVKAPQLPSVPPPYVAGVPRAVTPAPGVSPTQALNAHPEG